MSDRPTPAETEAPSVVVCLHCHRRFHSPTDTPTAVIECPCCGAQARRDTLSFPPAGTEARPARHIRKLWGPVAATLFAFAVLGAVAFALQSLLPTAPPAGPTPAPHNSYRSGDAAVLDEARAAAERILGCPDWPDAHPFVLDADRVAPLMARYHSRHPWIPITLVGPHQGTVTTTGTARTAKLTVRSDRGSSHTLHLRHTQDGWKLDWEQLVNARHFAWHTFHEEKPPSPVALEILARRGSATDAHFVRAGLTTDTGLPIRLDGPRPGLSTLAIVPKASDLGRLFQRELTWEHPLPYRCLLRFIDPDLAPPLVEITEFVGEGWP